MANRGADYVTIQWPSGPGEGVAGRLPGNMLRKIRRARAELKLDVLRERDEKDNLDRQLREERKIRGIDKRVHVQTWATPRSHQPFSQTHMSHVTPPLADIKDGSDVRQPKNAAHQRKSSNNITSSTKPNETCPYPNTRRWNRIYTKTMDKNGKAIGSHLSPRHGSAQPTYPAPPRPAPDEDLAEAPWIYSEYSVDFLRIRRELEEGVATGPDSIVLVYIAWRLRRTPRSEENPDLDEISVN
ncbi:hypothetical protein GWI33_010207 [Rhynchophorus ferrugineus]|uniref:Uncharacterized protein n=1 Tax=Rhynchophorus ferrugineus TaxID=354439 RepID=A0A834IV75_RHYFE|nr:hypothetical protein GWI33_010207 [Rhynchophorus ferrugineus]